MLQECQHTRTAGTLLECSKHDFTNDTDKSISRKLWTFSISKTEIISRLPPFKISYLVLLAYREGVLETLTRMTLETLLLNSSRLKTRYHKISSLIGDYEQRNRLKAIIWYLFSQQDENNVDQAFWRILLDEVL